MIPVEGRAMTKMGDPVPGVLPDRLDEKLKAVRDRRIVRDVVVPSLSVRRLAREANGLSQQDIADLLGVSRMWVVQVEGSATTQPVGELRIRYRDLVVRLIKTALAAELEALNAANARLSEPSAIFESVK
jgi:predicted transcriptional regulator